MIKNTCICIMHLEYVHTISKLCVDVESAAQTVTQNHDIPLQVRENHFYQQACQPASWELSHVGTRQETGYSIGSRNIKYQYGGVTVTKFRHILPACEGGGHHRLLLFQLNLLENNILSFTSYFPISRKEKDKKFKVIVLLAKMLLCDDWYMFACLGSSLKYTHKKYCHSCYNQSNLNTMNCVFR